MAPHPAHILLLQVLLDCHLPAGQVVEALTSDRTSWDPGMMDQARRFYQQHLPAASCAVIEDYLEQNLESAPVADVYGSIPLIDLKGEEEVRAVFIRDGGWDSFRRRFPHSQGILQLSRPGFSPDGTPAMICVGQQLGPREGDGICYLYRRTETGWVKEAQLGVWKS